MPTDLSALVALAFSPRSAEPSWKWAARNIYIGERGHYWDPSLTPWVLEPMERAPDPGTTEIHWMKSSRTGVSQACYNHICWMPQHAPGDVLYTIDSQEEIRNISKTKLRQAVSENAGRQLPADPDDLTSLTLRLRNMTIYLGGGASEGVFNNKAITFGAVDEAETQRLNKQGTSVGGSTIDLTRSRFTTVENPCLWTMSKPQLEGGIIHAEWLLGTREIYLVPCPHCGTLQELTQEKLVFDHCKTLGDEWDYARLDRETFIRCEAGSCGKLIDEKHKRDMVQDVRLGGAARWLQTNPNPRPRVRSYHISDLYSLFPQVGWGRLAEAIIRASGSDEKRKFVRNNHFGLPWSPRTVQVDQAAIMRLRAGHVEKKKKDKAKPGFPRRSRLPGQDEPEPAPSAEVPRYSLVKNDLGWFADHCPIVPAYLSICIDVQHDRIKGTTAAFTRTGEMWLLGYFATLSFADIPALARVEFPVPAAGEGAPPASAGYGLIDSADGNRTYEIYEWCQDHPELNLWPSRGGARDLTGGRFVNVVQFKHRSRPLIRYDYNDHQLKCLLYHSKIARLATPRLYMPSDLADHPQLWTEFQNENLVIGNDKWGHPVQRWKLTGPNDWPDSTKMHYVIWDQLAPAISAP